MSHRLGDRFKTKSQHIGTVGKDGASKASGHLEILENDRTMYNMHGAEEIGRRAVTDYTLILNRFTSVQRENLRDSTCRLLQDLFWPIVLQILVPPFVLLNLLREDSTRCSSCMFEDYVIFGCI